MTAQPNPDAPLLNTPEGSQQPKSPSPLRLALLVGVIVLVVGITGFLIYPQLQPASAPLGTVYPITPRPRPQSNGVTAGDPHAKVRIDVYEDFQCPACKDYSQAIEPQVMDNDVATGRVYYVFHSYLVIDHATWESENKESHQAANAAMCAADQNRFWDYHDILFNNWTGENVGDDSDARLVAYAESLKLDMGRFKACFRANQFKAKIDEDIAAAKKLGVNGTPSVFVNGKQVSPGYVPGYNLILKAIDEAQ